MATIHSIMNPLVWEHNQSKIDSVTLKNPDDFEDFSVATGILPIGLGDLFLLELPKKIAKRSLESGLGGV